MRLVGVALAIAALIAVSCGGGDTATPRATGDTTASVASSTPPVESTGTADAGTTTPATVTPEASTTAEPTTSTTSDVGESWTVLLYSIADTDLEPFMMRDVDEMGSVPTGDNLHLVALVDRAAAYSSDSVLGIPDWQGAKLVDVGNGTATVLEDRGDINTGDPTVLADFITRGIAENPADHYVLIISDHGASWPGVGGDESSGHDGLSLAEIGEGISGGLTGAGIERLDLLGFDACLMATYEVASTLAPLADRMVASQELEPGHGWDYRSLEVLDGTNPATVDTLGAAILDGFAAQAQAEGTDADITLSLIDLTRMNAVDQAMADFAGALSDRVAQMAPVIGDVRARTLGFGRSPDPLEDLQMADLGQLVAEIGVQALDVSDQADALIRAMNDAVIQVARGPATLGATGLSIYFPSSDELFSPAYPEAVGDSPWLGLLASYYEAGNAIPPEDLPRFVNDEGVADVQFVDGGITITGSIDPEIAANVSDAVMSYGIIEADGAVTFIGEEPATVAEDSSATVTGEYDLTALTISDGEDTAYAYLTLSAEDDAGVISVEVPMAYYAPDDVGGETYQDVLLSITLDAATLDILDETYYAFDDSLGTYGELTADPAGIIVPEHLVVSPDGSGSWVPTSEIGLFADLATLQYDFEPLAPGTPLYVELTVTDFGGNTATVSAQVEVP